MEAVMRRRERVNLYIRIERDGNRLYAVPDLKKQRTAIVGGKAERHDEGMYYIRFEQDGCRRWEQVGDDLGLALTKRKIRESELTLGLNTTDLKRRAAEPKPTKTSASLVQAVDKYIETTVAAKAPRTAAAYRLTLREFAAGCSKPAAQVTQDDLMQFAVRLKQDGMSDRTIANRVANVVTFLKKNGSSASLRWKYTEKKVRSYRPDELKAMFSVADPDEWLLFQFFLGSGSREQEVMHACWPDVDFNDGVFTVREHLEFGFKPKDSEEREIPLPDHLLDALRMRRQEWQDAKLVFPNQTTGRPDGHMLRKLKRLAKRAGLDPNGCNLHQWRKTYATLQHRNGVDARTIQKRLGHSSLETTLAYLEAEDARSERTREKVNGTFGEFAKAGQPGADAAANLKL
jgi:integrase